MSDINQLIKTKLEARLRGEGGFWTPEVMTQMKQELFEENQGAERRAVQQLNADVARRGLFRTGVAAKGAAQISRDAMSSYTKGIRAMLLKKAEMEWQDEKEATRDAQQWLNGQRQYMLGKEQNAIAREQVKATIAAASISASASRYAADQGLKGARAAAGASRASAAASLGLATKQHQLNVAKFKYQKAKGL
jgi:hypothetical protein